MTGTYTYTAITCANILTSSSQHVTILLTSVLLRLSMMLDPAKAEMIGN